MANNSQVVRGILRALTQQKLGNFNSTLSPLTVVSSTNDGRAHFQWKVDSSHVNSSGYLHNGCLSGLIDLATSSTVMSMKNGIVPVTTSIDIRFMGTIRNNETADIFTKVIKLGKVLSVFEATICHNVTGDLIATGKHTAADSGQQLVSEFSGLSLHEFVESIR